MPSRWLLLLAVVCALDARAQKLSEFVAHHAGPVDDHQYVELIGAPAPADYSTLRFLVVEGSASANPGRIASVLAPVAIGGAGVWWTGYLTSQLESPTFTILLVSGFTGAHGDDLDTNDDGTLDAAPWTAILDSVALTDGAAGARTYSPAVLDANFDGLGVVPGGASRFPYYRDTDTAADWKRNDFDGEGLTGFTGTLAPGEAANTPGLPTRVTQADFYAGVDTSSAAALRTTLHAAIKDHVRYPYTSSYTDTWDILNAADEDPGDATRILDTYKNERYTKITGGTGVYNREHSWPNSYGFPSSTPGLNYPYSDCMHLFLTDTTYNANRGNNPYGTCNAGCTELPTTANYGYGGGSGTYPGNSNWLSGTGNSSIWESWNHRKGDLARASLYLDVRYEGETHGVTNEFEPDLVLTDDTTQIVTKTASVSSPQAFMGRLATLLAWNAFDAPDDTERRHHEVVAGYQGNRNPFVDHPEWAACVWQSTGCAPRLPDEATIDTGRGTIWALRRLSTSPRTATSWSWEITSRPAGSTAALSATSVRNPTFTPDVAGVYVFRLTAGNGVATNVSTISLDAGGLRFHVAAPCRVLDTRDPDGPLGGPALNPGEDRSFPVAGACGIPSTARAVSSNVTITQPVADGHLVLHAGDEPAPLASTISFGPEKTRANNAIVKLATDGTGTVRVLCGGAGPVHLILDVNGWFE